MSATWNRKVARFMERDEEILMFLWNFKVATTAAVHAYFFPNVSMFAAYKRLNRLKTSGLIDDSLSQRTKNGGWELTSKGYKFLKHRLPELKEEGYKSESPDHDLLVNAVLMGPWVSGLDEKASILTEQHLRRISSENLPDWVPLTSYRRPDGYWRVFQDDRWWTLSLEVETSQKSLNRYVDLIDSYQYLEGLDRAIWVLSTPAHLKLLDQHIQTQPPKVQHKHNLLLEKDLKKLGWKSIVQSGPESGETLDFILTRGESKFGQTFDQHPFLDFRKIPSKPNVYQPRPKASILTV